MMDVSEEAAKFRAENERLEREFTSFVEPHLTDLGNAKRFIMRYGDDVKYVPSWGWLAFDGKRWKRDAEADVWRFGKETVLNMHNQASYIESDDKRRELIKHALWSESEARIAAMISLAKSESKVIARPEDFDRDPLLFNVFNGTLDLRTGQLRAHRREDLLTKMSPVVYDPEATCPRWELFLREIFNGNADLIAFTHKAVGYSLTASVKEQCLFLLHGAGCNGKTVFLEVLRNLFGDYARVANAACFLAKSGDGIPNDVAMLAGARLVTSSELEAERRLAESLIKGVTGGDTITARFLHREWFEFRPQFKLFLATNHKPIIKGRERAIWRRIHLIPFDVTFDEARQDKQLVKKLTGELSGILNWAVGGCLLWLVHGLKPPDEVKAATGKYREDMDTVGIFLKECCNIGTGEVGAGALYKVYREWAGRGAVSQRIFGETLGELGYEWRILRGKKVYKGLELIESGDSGDS